MEEEGIDLHRAWGFQELAVRYCPWLMPSSATNQLYRWIRHSAELQQQLAKSGYRRHQKLLTPRQVRCLVEYLGEP